MVDNPLEVGHYRLGKTLGIGAFGKVKLGEHIITGHRVAIKILNRHRIKQLDMGEKVRREINILKICTHPHIIRLYEVIDTPSDIFVVMEYVAGGELFDYIVSKGRLQADEARRFFHQIISGVEYCHFHHIVHRDLKPENLLLDADNNIKLADFGLSNMMKDGEFLRTSCGSPNYAAPEVISGNLYAGPEVDVWSCGVILYALLCGSLPFDDESIPNLFKKIKSGMYTLPSHMSQLSRDLIPRMLVVDPMKRITIPEIRQHPWFQYKLPTYLRLPPDQMEKQERVIDEECIAEVCRAPFRGVTRQRVIDAIQRKNKRHDLRVAYEIILDHKQSKARTQEVQMIMQSHHENTPPAFSPHCRTPGSAGGGMYTPPQHPSTSAHLQAQQQLRLAEEASRALARGNAIAHGGLPPPPPQPGMPPNPVAALGSTGQLGMSQQQQQAAAAASASKRRRWYLGIQSKKDPTHVMTEVYKALMALDCEWTIISSYRVKCRWRPNMRRSFDHIGHRPSFTLSRKSSASISGYGRRASEASYSSMTAGGAPMDVSNDDAPDFWPCDPSQEETNPLLALDYTVIIGLNLYKVQQNIYLLDFQRMEGDCFSFMNLSARIITELKTLSAASRQQQQQQQQQQQLQAMSLPTGSTAGLVPGGAAVMGGASVRHHHLPPGVMGAEQQQQQHPGAMATTAEMAAVHQQQQHMQHPGGIHHHA